MDKHMEIMQINTQHIFIKQDLDKAFDEDLNKEKRNSFDLKIPNDIEEEYLPRFFGVSIFKYRFLKLRRYITFSVLWTIVSLYGGYKFNPFRRTRYSLMNFKKEAVFGEDQGELAYFDFTNVINDYYTTTHLYDSKSGKWFKIEESELEKNWGKIEVGRSLVEAKDQRIRFYTDIDKFAEVTLGDKGKVKLIPNLANRYRS